MFLATEEIWGPCDFSNLAHEPRWWPWGWRPDDGRPYNPAVVDHLHAYELSGPWGWDRLEIWPQLRPVLRPLRDSLLAWGMRWRLDQAWCLRRALRQLDAWYRSPLAEQAAWTYSETSVRAAASDEERRFVLEVPGWQPTGERWGDAEARLVVHFTIACGDSAL